MFQEMVSSLLAEGCEVDFTARGRSMAPCIRDGESVRVRPLASRPRLGEVLLCRGSHGALLLHRVVRLTGTTVITRGDALANEDAPVPRSHILGRAVAISGRRRLLLGFPFGLILPLRRRLFPRAAGGPLTNKAARRLWSAGARM